MNPATNLDFGRARRENLRWLILLTLNHARPTDISETPILSVAQSQYPDATALELRREMDYLDSRALIVLTKQPGGLWLARLSRHGVDVCEYTVEVEPGIARPTKYWAG